MSKILYINNNNFHNLGRSQMCAGGRCYFRPSKPHSGTLWSVFSVLCELLSLLFSEVGRFHKTPIFRIKLMQFCNPEIGLIGTGTVFSEPSDLLFFRSFKDTFKSLIVPHAERGITCYLQMEFKYLLFPFKTLA